MQKAGWAPELVWMFWGREKCFVPTKIGTQDHPASRIVTILTMLPCPQTDKRIKKKSEG